MSASFADRNCQTAVVTGANSGVGYALCDRLLLTYPTLRLAILCRNQQRGQAAFESLLASHPSASIDFLLCDVGNVVSVKQCCLKIKELYDHIDFLFLNAGIMANPKVNAGTVFTTFLQPRLPSCMANPFSSFSLANTGVYSVGSKLVHRFTTGADLLRIDDGTTHEGFKRTFATNVLGHFCMVKELDEVLGGESPSRVIWTSSRMANKDSFSVADIQHSSGKDPYASSKYLIDSVSVAMNDRLRSKNVTACTTCPGLMMSGISLGILPYWIWYMLVPIIKLLRVFVPSFTWEPCKGAEALLWLTTQESAALDPMSKHCSMCTVFGNAYATSEKMDIDVDVAQQCYQQLDSILRDFNCTKNGGPVNHSVG